MLKYQKIQNLCLSTLLAFATHVSGATSTCPSAVFSDLCEKLMSHEDGDWISCKVVFNRPPMDPGGTPDPKTDPVLDTPSVQSDTATPAYMVEYTQTMFGKYDFRIWDDQFESSTPDGGKIPPFTFPTRVGGSYRGFTTKKTIISLAAESYIQVVEDWQVPIIVALSHTRHLPSKPGVISPFNVKGQRLGTAAASIFMIHGSPGKP